MHEKERAAMKADTDVTGLLFVGETGEIFHPTQANRLYVEKKDLGATFYGGILTETQQFELLFKGVPPEHYGIAYLGPDGHILSEPPPLITRQEMLDVFESVSAEDWRDAGADTPEPPDFCDRFTENIPIVDTRHVPKPPLTKVPDLQTRFKQAQFKQAQQETENVRDLLIQSDAEAEIEATLSK